MRRLALLFLATAATATATVALATPASAESRCYTLGVPGQNHYMYCTYLPIDPEDIIR